MSCTTCMRIMIYKNSFSNWFCDLQFIERYKKDYKKEKRYGQMGRLFKENFSSGHYCKMKKIQLDLSFVSSIHVFIITCGAADEPRALALVLARACSLTSARSSASAS